MNTLLPSDPRIGAMPIQENGDPFIDVRDEGRIVIGPSPEIPDNRDYTYLRKTVYQKLLEAQRLLPSGLRFCLYEGYRSLELQQRLFEDRFAIIKAHHPEWSYEQQFIETQQLVAPTINLDGTPNIPSHAVGSAIDVYLIDDDGTAVDMGIHPKDWMLDYDGSLSVPDSKKISEEAKRYRAIMNRVLEQVGFVNVATEYWHWSYGDRYWACAMGKTSALYGLK
ncbi:MAG: M15 family metallopeptidase [Chthoniobacterales bacterium]|nr:M15 family metallopeptidase [Chthoniobacterales bacterium]